MSDLISRHAAIDAVERNSCNTQRAIDAVNALPSVQPEPCSDAISRQGAIEPLDIVFDEPTIEERKTGKWINANDGKWNTVEVLKCSVCGEIDNRMYRTDNFCPNCGAKMEGEDDGTD